MKKLYFVVLCIFVLINTSLRAQDVRGSWKGELSIQGTKLPLVFNVKVLNDSLIVTMDSPMQGAKGIPTTYSKFENNVLSLKAIQLMIQYDGKLINDSVIDGTFMQGGASFPLKLSKGNVSLNRPQEPLPPYPYNSEDIVFENYSEGFQLAGTFTYPKKGSKFPVVVMVTGSGSQDRNEEIFGHKPFLVIADYLTRNGIAVLRFDDRGVGGSKGSVKNITTRNLATDTRSAMNYLLTRNEIDPSRMGIVGHSEGGCIAFMLAAEYDDIAFVVSMAGGAIRGDSLMKEQRLLIGLASGMNTQIIEQNEQLLSLIQGYVENKTEKEIAENLDSFIEDKLMVKVSGFPKKYIPSKDRIKSEVLAISSAWFQYFVKYDPSKDIRRIKCPILAINGSKDLQVKASSNLGSISENAPHAIVKEYKGLNHLFQNSKTGLINEYGEIEETIEPQVLKDICDWINEIVK